MEQDSQRRLPKVWEGVWAGEGSATPRSDSGLNSLEYWDYSVELECITGQQDLQLAAELGKTLLERNKELELSLKHQQSVIDDQNMEIEYLAKQAAALRDMNESRMKVYEQLEVSMVDIERHNQRLCEDNGLDKEKIRSLSATVQTLERQCEDLQRCLDEVVLRRGSPDSERDRDSPVMTKLCNQPTPLRQHFSCQVCSHASLDAGPTEPENAREDWQDWRGCQPTQESGYGSLGYRDSETDCCDSLEEATQVSPALVNQLSQTDNNHQAEDVFRLSQEISSLRQEIVRGDRQIKELEEQVGSLMNENLDLVTCLDWSSKQQSLLGVQRSSSVQQEVLAVEQVSRGRLCSRCLASTEDNSHLFLQLLEISKFWTSEIGSWIKRWLNVLLIRLFRSPSSVPWLDRWLVTITMVTMAIAIVRTFLHSFLFRL